MQRTADLPPPLILSLHYRVKCKSGSLAIHNNESILGSAYIDSENHQDHKMIN